MNDRIENAINEIEKSLNLKMLNLFNLGLTTQDLVYLFNLNQYKEFFVNLEVLDLQHNNLSTLPEKIFDKLVNLEILDLQHNNLSTLPEKMLDKLVNLAILELQNNNLSTLPEKMLDNLVNLEELYLDKSNLTLPEKIKNKKGLQIYY